MQKLTVAVIVGSLRTRSYNRQLAQALKNLAPTELAFEDVRIDDLPLYNQDDDGNQHPAVRRMKSAIEAAQALLFITPEYNRSVPGVLKNALDHGSRPHGKNSWAGRPGGIAGISPGAIRTAAAQQHLRTILAAVQVPTFTQAEAYLHYTDDLFDDQGNIRPADTRKVLQVWLDKYATFIGSHYSRTV